MVPCGHRPDVQGRKPIQSCSRNTKKNVLGILCVSTHSIVIFTTLVVHVYFIGFNHHLVKLLRRPVVCLFISVFKHVLILNFARRFNSLERVATLRQDRGIQFSFLCYG